MPKRETYQDGVLISSEDYTVPPEQVNADTLRDRANKALDTNKTYLAKTSPSNAEVVAQVRVLTLEASALIRFLLGRFEAVE